MKAVQDIVCIFVFWAPVLLSCAAEREYFLQTQNATWAQARHHCQVCFKELVSVTPLNSQTVVRLLNLTSDFWIGLRKNLNASGSGLAVPWSHWANGDPITFQNWYPGRPKPKPLNLTSGFTPTSAPTTTPNPTSASTSTSTSAFTPVCNCCCPSYVPEVPDITDFTDVTSNTEQTIITMTTVPTIAPTPSSTMTPSGVSNSTSDEDEGEDEDDMYIEDPCVAMLFFGAWTEKDCMTHLPFICYEDRFYGNATVADVTSKSATLSWLAGPGDISGYRVEVSGGALPVNLLSLTYNLVNLIPGTSYSVKVFAIKCGRDLNPQSCSFFTKPGTVQDLIVTKVTDTSVSLNWTRPAGNVDRYRVRVSSLKDDLDTDKERIDVGGLLPGGLHTFDVIAGVRDNSTWGEVVSTQAYTKPDEVSRLTTSEHKDTSLLLKWEKPKGNLTGYRVTAVNANKTLYNETVDHSALSHKVEKLPVGTKLHLSVTALANGSLEGKSVTVVSYTAPAPIYNLQLTPASNSINVNWSAPQGDRDHFVIRYHLSSDNNESQKVSTNTMINLSELKAGANYTVTVNAKSGDLLSPDVSESVFTLPVKPRNLEITSFNKSSISLKWDPPEDVVDVQYLVSVSAPFWGTSWSKQVSKTDVTFDGLNAGTKYHFKVQTVAGGRKSTAVPITRDTVAEKKEVTLSMLCSSTESLRCEQQSIRDSVLSKLKEHFKELLEEEVFWDLKWQSL